MRFEPCETCPKTQPCPCIKTQGVVHKGQYYFPTGVRAHLSKTSHFGLTKKQRDLLFFVNDYITGNKCSPSFDEMKDALNLKSKSGIHRLVTALQERGYIDVQPHRSRSIVIRNWPAELDEAIEEAA